MRIKSILFLVVVSFYASVSFGQSKRINIGLEQGPSLTFLRGTDISKDRYDPIRGFSAGLIFQYNFPQLISIRTNIAYERKGAKYQIQSAYYNYDPTLDMNRNLNLDYLTIPVLIQLSFGNNRKFFANIGPYFSSLIKQTVISTFEYEIEEYRKLDWGISSGLGVRFTINDNLLLIFELRNNLGLYDISKVIDYNVGSSFTNSTNLLIGIAYQFGSKNN